MENYKVNYFKNTNIKSSEEYFLDGSLHREDGPAYIGYLDDGMISYVSYSINGKRHREDGPAQIWYGLNGEIEIKKYWIRGYEITDIVQLMVIQGLENGNKKDIN